MSVSLRPELPQWDTILGGKRGRTRARRPTVRKEKGAVRVATIEPHPLLPGLYPIDLQPRDIKQLIAQADRETKWVVLARAEDDTYHLLLDGYPLWRAAKEVGRPTLPAEILALDPTMHAQFILDELAARLVERQLLSPVTGAALLKAGGIDRIRIARLLGWSPRLFDDLCSIVRRFAPDAWTAANGNVAGGFDIGQAQWRQALDAIEQSAPVREIHNGLPVSRVAARVRKQQPRRR
jgi:hypothetical protein